MSKKITGDDCVKVLKTMSYGGRAADIGYLLGTNSHAVASALRKAVKDGRVKINAKGGAA